MTWILLKDFHGPRWITRNKIYCKHNVLPRRPKNPFSSYRFKFDEMMDRKPCKRSKSPSYYFSGRWSNFISVNWSVGLRKNLENLFTQSESGRFHVSGRTNRAGLNYQRVGELCFSSDMWSVRYSANGLRTRSKTTSETKSCLITSETKWGMCWWGASYPNKSTQVIVHFVISP